MTAGWGRCDACQRYSMLRDIHGSYCGDTSQCAACLNESVATWADLGMLDDVEAHHSVDPIAIEAEAA